jgi:rod shape-determining protein MreC
MVVQHRDSRRRALLVLLAATSIILATVDSNGSSAIDRARSTAQDAAAPLQDAVNSVVNPVSDWVSGISDGGKLRAENARLRDRLGRIEAKLNKVRAEGNQLSELEKLLDLSNIEDATGVPARVVGLSPGNFGRSVQLDRGSDAGLVVGMPVVSGGGLVGKVTQVASTRATVTLIDSPDIGIGVRLEKSRVQGITSAKLGDRLLNLEFLENPRAEIAVNELVFTSGVKDSAFPPDLAVGKVVSVDRRQGSLDPDVRVRPIVDLDRIEFVKVLHYVPPATP